MKHFRKTIALFLVVVMLTTTMGSTVLAGTENQGFSDQAETTVDSRFLDGIDTDGYDYVITSQEQADELRVSDDSKSILVACGSVYLSGITAESTGHQPGYCDQLHWCESRPAVDSRGKDRRVFPAD